MKVPRCAETAVRSTQRCSLVVISTSKLLNRGQWSTAGRPLAIATDWGDREPRPPLPGLNQLLVYAKLIVAFLQSFWFAGLFNNRTSMPDQVVVSSGETSALMVIVGVVSA